MAEIFTTKNFIVESFETPHVDRTDGGHIRIVPKKEITDRTYMAPKIAIEYIRLTMIVGEALKNAMTKRGIEIIRVNYQDMGNWAYKAGKQPFFHLHIYGRAKNAKYQPCQEAVQLPDRSTGFYDKFQPLNEGDISEIKQQIGAILNKPEYQSSEWGL